jgi:hypothetical protein
VRIFLLLSATPTRADSGRSRMMRVGFPTGTRRCRSSEEAHSLLGWRVCAYRERRTLPQKKTLIILWSAFCTLSFVNPNTWHLICNNFNLNFIFGIVCLCVCICAFSLRRESPDMILGDKPLISEVVLSHPTTQLRLYFASSLARGSHHQSSTYCHRSFSLPSHAHHSSVQWHTRWQTSRPSFTFQTTYQHVNSYKKIFWNTTTSRGVIS